MRQENGTYSKEVYARLQELIEEGAECAAPPDLATEGYSALPYLWMTVVGFLKEKWGAIAAGVGFAAAAAWCLHGGTLLARGILEVNPNVLPDSPAWYLTGGIAPFLVWACSTLFDYWNYHARKKRMMLLCVANAGMHLASVLYLVLYAVLSPLLLLIPINRDISAGMVLSLGRLLLGGGVVAAFVTFLHAMATNLSNPMTEQSMYGYKLGKKLDMRKNKRFAYDLNIVADLKSGKRHVIKMKDRFLHSLANGVTGTGKTATCFTVGIANDINQGVLNQKYQEDEVFRLLKKGSVRMTGPFGEGGFCLDKFQGVDERAEHRLARLKQKAPIAGVSAMAPNAAFADEIYEMAKTKGRKANRLDPVMEAGGKRKEGYVGFNPLYLCPDVNPVDSPHEWVLEISNKAIICANVLQAIFDAGGQSDIYFASLNRNITTTLAMLVMLTHPAMRGGRQPTLETVQEILNDFLKAKPYRDQLILLYGKKDETGQLVMKSGRPDVGVFQMVLEVVDSEILGKGSEKIFDQCRGLRVIMNTFLMNTYVRNILCCKESIDLDKALANGEITVVNYALEYDSAGIAFGLFYLLNFINAVERRPGKESTRVPHFFYVDELPVLLHPKIEHCFTLFRQYKVASFMAVQSLSQMEKGSGTAYLKDVLVGNCAHHFVFGRVAPEEMELYEALGGQGYFVQEMKGVTETSLTDDDPHLSYNTRESLVRESLVSGTDVRNRDAQEVTVVTVDNGSPVGMFFGKTSFLPRYKRIGRRKRRIDWSAFLQTPPAGNDDPGGEGGTEGWKDVSSEVSVRPEGEGAFVLPSGCGRKEEDMPEIMKEGEEETIAL